MNIRKIEENEKICVLKIIGTNTKVMNAIRRCAMSDVPVLAVENIAIHKNSSVLFDEYIGMRLALLPIKTDPKIYKKGDKVKLVLKERGPKVVTSADIKCSDPNVEITAKDVPIVKLKDGQQIFFEMEAVVDTGREHAKWQPALIAYYELPKLDGEVDEKTAKNVLNSCPKKILEYRAGKVLIERPESCDLCFCCEEASNGKLKLNLTNNSFILKVETYGSLKPALVLEKAIEAIRERCEKFEDELKKLK
ncbi:MAG: DNA-directed RNA polymerase subunit D [Candidatus Diapherotrites archaeon]|nr:DNA-directed RNA polymerase subunit D [Candidatus Diapherotrites archaeon]